MKKMVIGVLVLMWGYSSAQSELTLDECYRLVNTNYPLAKRGAMLSEQNALDLKVVNTQKLPQLDLNAQATYQSDVVSIPLPNACIEPINNDQYKATLTVNQLIYGSGIVKASAHSKNAGFNTKQKQLEVSLYQLKKQVNQLYFSILLIQQQKQLLLQKEKALQAKWEEAKSAVKNGVLIATADKVFELELLKIKQQLAHLDQNKKSGLETLSLLIGQAILPNADLQNPIISSITTQNLNRPELELFQLRQKEVESSEFLLSKKTKPKLAAFATGGYGNPGLNFLDNSFQPYYIVGVKLNWNILDWSANKKSRESLLVNKEIIENERELFELNTSIELKQQRSEIEKLLAFIDSDTEIISLRKEVLKSSESQLKNGVITSSVYLNQLTHLYEDEINLKTHEIQLLLAQANYNITKGE